MNNITTAAQSLSSSTSATEENFAEENELIDFSKLSKSELMHLLQELKLEHGASKANSILKQIKSNFDNHVEMDKQSALQKYAAEGGDTADFEFKKEEIHQQFEKLHDVLREKITGIFSSAEKEKEKNLAIKKQILENLRELIAQEETNKSIIALKEYQEQWRKTGPVTNAAHQELWQSYTALIDRFYNNRSIYFELKELDRKKNHEAKVEICEKAEQLLHHDSINHAIRELKTLHEEYKSIGPVPKEVQEELWQKFKDVSDKIYDKRTAYLNEIKTQQDQALVSKEQIIEKLQDFASYNSDRIDDWKIKTAELLALQEEWKKIGNVPFEASKEISKRFWASCKAYFANKETFFSALEAKKKNNLSLKVALCEQAEALQHSEDLQNSTIVFKDLQKQWDKIGSVPIKQKEAIFARFKLACDTFFQKKRDLFNEQEKQYEINLEEKLAICAQIETLGKEGKADEVALRSLQAQYNAIGFVPKDKIKQVQDKYNEAINTFIASIDQLGDGKSNNDLKLSLEISALKNSPDADKKIMKREGDVVKQINTLKAEINQYGTNMEFFGRSATAEKMKKEIQVKIDVAKEELKKLEAQLKIIKHAQID